MCLSPSHPHLSTSCGAAKSGSPIARGQGFLLRWHDLLYEAYTWHGNRHTFASRLVMAGVDLRTVQQPGGWQSLAMVQRYAHLAPDHLRAAVERLVQGPDRVELGQD